MLLILFQNIQQLTLREHLNQFYIIEQSFLDDKSIISLICLFLYQNPMKPKQTISVWPSINHLYQTSDYQSFIYSMEIQRTNSLQIEGPEANFGHSETIIEKRAGHSDYGLSTLFASRARVPNFMQQTLKGSRGEASMKDSGEVNMKKSKLGNMLRSKLKEMQNLVLCEVCETEMKKSDTMLWMSNCDHKYNFCESCLHHYVIYKVKIFQEVRCPHEECPAIIDTTSSLFKQLPADVQKRYTRLHNFYEAAKDPNVKLCPKENCEGMIRTTLENVMVCDKCESHFCGKCLLAKHQGECDKHQVEFFESNLHYRQCVKCKFVIEKNQGCNHMTCKCGYQFCYVCGAVWTAAHYNNHDQNGQLIVVENAVAPAANQNVEPCCDCQCCNQCCGDTLAAIFKAPLKLFLIILFSMLMIFIFCFRDLLVIIGMVIVCILAGLFGFSFEILSELEGGACVLGVIFFPFLMMVGIGIAFREIFCDVIPEMCEDYWGLFGDGMRSICEI